MIKQHPPAPEFSGIHTWINSLALTMKELRGKVVGIEFWTHGCSNCVHAAPRMQQIYDTYAKKGFVLIGVHTPEIPEEKNMVGIKRFLLRHHITYPIATDFDEVMWKAYGNRYWPTLYLIDKHGRVRERHIGDGGYARIIQDIEYLLEGET
jgi:thiol-disulfide isomerase/thioredoxin